MMSGLEKSRSRFIRLKHTLFRLTVVSQVHNGVELDLQLLGLLDDQVADVFGRHPDVELQVCLVGLALGHLEHAPVGLGQLLLDELACSPWPTFEGLVAQEQHVLPVLQDLVLDGLLDLVPHS